MTIEREQKTGVIYRRWEAPQTKAVFLLVHGLGGHSARWGFLADHFLKNNISSYAIELKGFGETQGIKGHIDSFDTYLRDAKSLRDIIDKRNPGKKVFLLGESLGALISLLVAGREPGLFSGLVCISPAFQNKMKVSLSEYAKIFVSILFDPKRKIDIPFTSDMCTRDGKYQKVMDEDPREIRFATARFILQIFIAQIKSSALRDKIKDPVLFLLSGEDRLVVPEAARRVFDTLKVKDKTLLEYPGMYHALSIDLERDKVFNDIMVWAEKRI